jgi:hypothetical protein
MTAIDDTSVIASMTNEEFLANYNDYIEELRKLVEKVNKHTDCEPTEPGFYSGDGVNVLVSSVNTYGTDTYLMSHNLGEKVSYAAFAYIGDGYRLSNDEEFYECQNDGHVTHYDSATGYTEELLDTFNDDDPNPSIIYRQSFQLSPKNYNALVMNYPINGFKDPKVTVNYLHNKTPNYISFDKILFGKSFSKTYVLNENDNLYHRVTPQINGYRVYVPFVQPSTKDGLIKIINSRGFRSNPSDDVIELYRNDNNYVKTIKKVADMYKENAKK